MMETTGRNIAYAAFVLYGFWSVNAALADTNTPLEHKSRL